MVLWPPNNFEIDSGETLSESSHTQIFFPTTIMEPNNFQQATGEELEEIIDAMTLNEDVSINDYIFWSSTRDGMFNDVRRVTLGTLLDMLEIEAVVPTALQIANLISAASAKTTPVDNDKIAITDSADSYTLKRLSWGNLKAALATYTDTLYAGIAHTHSGYASTTHTHIANDITDFAYSVAAHSSVSANTAARHTHANLSVLDLISAAFTTDDETKLDGIEALADVTDATNVAAAGAFMKSVDDLDDITAGTTNKHFTDTEKTKLAGISTGANNYSHPNHTGDVTSTGDGATVLSSSAISGKTSHAGLVGTEEVLVNDAGTLKKTTTQDIADLAIGGGGSETTTTLGALINGAVAKTTPINADMLALMDSAASNIVKKLSWADVKAVLKTYNDTLYQPLDSDLTTLASLTATTNNFIVSVGSAWASITPSQVRTTLGLVIGTNVQAWDADLDTWATKTPPSGTAVGTTDTQTLTNKRVTERVTSEASSATPTINTDNSDAHSITALATAITSMTTNLSGTPTNFQKLIIRIKDNGTARAITWGASFEAKGVALPTTTVISKVLTVGFIYDTVTSKWGCVASAQEA